jgi:hypothetical protein
MHMEPASKSRAGDRQPGAGSADETDARDKKTPAPDMQPEDAGTAASGNEDAAAESAMKQEHKTNAERGAKG